MKYRCYYAADVQSRLTHIRGHIVGAGSSGTMLMPYHHATGLECASDGVAAHDAAIATAYEQQANRTEVFTMYGLQLTEEAMPSDKILQQMLFNRKHPRAESDDLKFRNDITGEQLTQLVVPQSVIESCVLCSGLLQESEAKPSADDDTKSWPYPYVRYNAAATLLAMKRAGSSMNLKLDCRDAQWRTDPAAAGSLNVAWASRYIKGSVHGEPDAPHQTMNRANMWRAPDAPFIWSRPVGGRLRRTDSFTYKKDDRLTRFTLSAGQGGGERDEFVDLFNDDFCGSEPAPMEQCMVTGVVGGIYLDGHDREGTSLRALRGAIMAIHVAPTVAILMREALLFQAMRLAPAHSSDTSAVLSTLYSLWTSGTAKDALFCKALVASLGTTGFGNPCSDFATTHLVTSSGDGGWRVALGPSVAAGFLWDDIMAHMGMLQGYALRRPNSIETNAYPPTYLARVRPVIAKVGQPDSWDEQATGRTAGVGTIYDSRARNCEADHFPLDCDYAGPHIDIMGGTVPIRSYDMTVVDKLVGWAFGCHNSGCSALFESDQPIERDVSDWDDSDDFFTNFFVEAE